MVMYMNGVRMINGMEMAPAGWFVAVVGAVPPFTASLRTSSGISLASAARISASAS